jgi:hypothetical protein
MQNLARNRYDQGTRIYLGDAYKVPESALLVNVSQRNGGD